MSKLSHWLRVIKKYPLFTLPLSIIFVTLSAIFFFAPTEVTFVQLAIAVFLLTYLMILASIMMLAIVMQIESGQKPRLFPALGKTLGINAVKALPLSLALAFVWLMLILASAASGKNRGSRSIDSLDSRLRSLSVGEPGATPFSFAGLGRQLLLKAIRMIVFLMLPAIVWENQGPIKAIKRGASIVKQHPRQALSTYGNSLTIIGLVAIPYLIIAALNYFGVTIPTEVIFATVLYSIFMLVFDQYIEQMLTANLFLWHRRWEAVGSQGSIESVARPDILDGIYEFSSPAPDQPAVAQPTQDYTPQDNNQ